MTLSRIINETLKWFSSLPILMQESFWWCQCSDRYIISLFPHLHTPSPPFSPSLINLMVSVDVKHHVYLLMCVMLFILQRISVTNIILSNNVCDVSIACLLLRSVILNHLYMVIFFRSFIFYLFVVVFCFACSFKWNKEVLG